MARNIERTFVVRVRNQRAGWADVKTGVTAGNFINVLGDLREGDEAAIRGTDQLRPGTQVSPSLAEAK